MTTFRAPAWYRLSGQILSGILRTAHSPRTGPWLGTGASRVWLHGASLGELKGVLTVARALPPDLSPVLTSTTAAGLARLRREAPEFSSFLAPCDSENDAMAFLQAFGIRKLLLFEAELWPNWIAAAARYHVSSALVAVRLQPPSPARWRRLWKLFPALPAALDAVWTAGDAPEAAEAAGFRSVRPGASLKWAGRTPLDVPVIPYRHAALSLHRRDAGVVLRTMAEWEGGWLLFPRRLRDLPFWRQQTARHGWKSTAVPEHLQSGEVWIAPRFGLVPQHLPGTARAWVSPGHDTLEPLFLGVPAVEPARLTRQDAVKSEAAARDCLAGILAWLQA